MQAHRARRRAPRRICPIDAAWKKQIRQIMEERGLSQAGLAKLIGASPPAIVLMFKRKTKASTLVPAIHEAFGLVPPPAPGVTLAIKAA